MATSAEPHVPGVMATVPRPLLPGIRATAPKPLLSGVMATTAEPHVSGRMDTTPDPQEFHSQSSLSPQEAFIPPQWDVDTAQNVMYWEDILEYFENAKGILKDGVKVLFLTDKKFNNLLPERIGYHPGVKLDVVIGDAICDTAISDGHDTVTSIEYSSQSTTLVSVCLFSKDKG